MRIWAAGSGTHTDRQPETRSLLVAEGGIAAGKDDERGARERLAVVMRHNAAALLLNRALFEFQADRGIKSS